jgi:NhaP-type Na+/H+ or K+/H+ antiporter
LEIDRLDCGGLRCNSTVKGVAVEIDLVVQTICVALFLSMAAQVLAPRLRLPSLILLFALGILAGPRFVHLLHVEGMGNATEALTAVGVAIILFEGGMNLRLSDLKHAPPAMYSIIGLGPFVAMALGTLVIHFVAGISWEISLVSAAVLTVSGPTVLHALTHHVHIKKKVRDLLSWEANVVEATGGILMVVVLHYVEVEGSGLLITAWHFVERIGIGAGVGWVTGRVLIWVITNRVVERQLVNLATLGIIMIAFLASNLVASEAGLLACAVAGVMCAQIRHPAMEELYEFKVQLSTLISSLVFLFLAAALPFEDFQKIGWPLVWATLLMVFVVRPLMILMTTWHAGVTLKERLFLGLMGPKGEVAAMTAALFGMILAHHHIEGAELIEVVVFSTVALSVAWSGLVAHPLAHLLGVASPPRTGFLLVGANPFSRAVAGALSEAEVPVHVMTANPEEAAEAKGAGLDVSVANALDEEEVRALHLERIGNMLAITEDDHSNTMSCRVGRKLFGMEHAYQVVNSFLSDVTDDVLTDFGGTPAFDLKMSVDLISERLQSGRLEVRTLPLSEAQVEHNQLPDAVLSALFWITPKAVKVAQEDDRAQGTAVIALSLALD